MTSRNAYKYKGQHAGNRSDGQIKDSYCKPMNCNHMFTAKQASYFSDDTIPNYWKHRILEKS